MNQELIQQIEKAVRKALEAQSLISVSTPAKKLLAIFDAAEIDLASPLQQLEKCIQGGYAVTVILSELAAKVLNVNEIRSVCGTEGVFTSGELADLRPFVENFPLIVLPIFPHSMGAKLALGLTDTPCTYLVFQAILRGDRVIAASEFLEKSIKNKRNSAISTLGQNYLKTLSEFGIEFVKTDRMAETILGNSDSSSYRIVDAIQRQTVISESTIAELASTVRELVYPNRAVITPLARDLSVKKGIRLVLN